MKKITQFFKRNAGGFIAIVVMGAFITWVFWIFWIPPFHNNGYRNVTITHEINNNEWKVSYSKDPLIGDHEWGYWRVKTKVEALKIKYEIKAGRIPPQ